MLASGEEAEMRVVLVGASIMCVATLVTLFVFPERWLSLVFAATVWAAMAVMALVTYRKRRPIAQRDADESVE